MVKLACSPQQLLAYRIGLYLFHGSRATEGVDAL